MQRFHNPVDIRIGPGAIDELAKVAEGRRCIVITSKGMVRRGTAARIEAALAGRVAATHAEVEPNPTIASCMRAAEELRGTRADLLIALGGGSVIDTAKALAAQRGHPDSVDWLSTHLREGEPFGETFEPPSILAIPTTAGTGSEVTMWGTIWDEASRTKRSVSHPRLYPEVALIDPTLTHSLPREATVIPALDALSHAMEAIWNRSGNPVSDAFAARAIRMIPAALVRAIEGPADAAAREALQFAALFAGLAISSTRTALAHSISYPLTAELGLPHGIACSLTLPELLRAVGARRPDRAQVIVEALGDGSVHDAAARVESLFEVVGVRATVRRQVPDQAALESLREGFIAPGRAENFILEVDQEWAEELLHRAYRSVAG